MLKSFLSLGCAALLGVAPLPASASILGYTIGAVAPDHIVLCEGEQKVTGIKGCEMFRAVSTKTFRKRCPDTTLMEDFLADWSSQVGEEVPLSQSPLQPKDLLNLQDLTVKYKGKVNTMLGGYIVITCSGDATESKDQPGILCTSPIGADGDFLEHCYRMLYTQL